MQRCGRRTRYCTLCVHAACTDMLVASQYTCAIQDVAQSKSVPHESSLNV